MRAQDDPKDLRTTSSVIDAGFRGGYIMGRTAAVQGGILGMIIGAMIASVPGIFLGAFFGALIALLTGATTGFFSFMIARLITWNVDDIKERMARIERMAIRGSVIGVAIGVAIGGSYNLLQTLLEAGRTDIPGIIGGFVLGTFIGAIAGARPAPITDQPSPGEPKQPLLHTTDDGPDASWLRIDVGGHVDQVRVRIVEMDRPGHAAAEALQRRDARGTDENDRGDEADTGEAGSGGLRLEEPSPLVRIDLLLPGQQRHLHLIAADGPNAGGARIMITDAADTEPIDLHIRYT